ncbi:MAG: hypothetical protein ABH843_00410 [Candidatus Omnitrophota bacterium]
MRMLGTVSLRKQSASLSVDKRTGEKASILIIALWSVSFLAAFAIIISYGVRQKAMVVQRLEDRDRLHLIADAGIKYAISELKKEEDKGYDSLGDGWSNNAGLFSDRKVGEGSFTISYNYLNPVSAEQEIRYGLIDEERKININKASVAVLKRFFQIVLGFNEMAAQELAASTVDWRDKDSSLSIPLGSAEDSYYRNTRCSYEAKDEEFEVLEELLLVKGMNQDIFNKIKDYVTIYGSGQVNINTTSEEVLLSLGLNEKAVYQILRYRYGKDEVPGTPDDNIFNSASNIVPRLSQSFSLSASEAAHINEISNMGLTTSSSNFLIRCVSSIDEKNISTMTECVVDKTGKMLYWHEV